MYGVNGLMWIPIRNNIPNILKILYLIHKLVETSLSANIHLQFE